MFKIELSNLTPVEYFPGLGAEFPISSDSGTAATAVVYMEVAPGGELPVHSDSAEELLLALEGEVEASIGDESGPLRAGEIAVVPAMAPHGLRNLGDRPARVLGFFGGSTNVATFPDVVFVVGGPRPIVVPLHDEAAVAA
jgi:quercetin dioxygenase-like cupin family protein